MPAPQQRSTRSHIAKAVIAFAVLMPAFLLIAAFVAHSRGAAVTYSRSRVQTLFLADAAILGIGLLLHRGEDL